MVEKAFIPAAIERRINEIPTETQNGLKVIRNFAIFIDTHRDQPHVGSLFPDIHRGQCRPIKVDYIVGEDLLYEPESGASLQRHDKHMYVEENWYTDWLMAWLMDHDGKLPTDADGIMPTSHFRDPREKRYLLKSFRQIVVSLYNNRR